MAEPKREVLVQLTVQLEKLNFQLEKLRRQGKIMIYSAHPLKFAFYNFLAGVAHSLGSLVGTVFVAGVILYFLSQFDLTSLVSRWVEKSLRQINWEKVIPLPTINSGLEMKFDGNLEEIKFPEKLESFR